MYDKTYILVDSANNRLHPDKTFDTFDDGWDFISTNYEEEDFEGLHIILLEDFED